MQALPCIGAARDCKGAGERILPLVPLQPRFDRISTFAALHHPQKNHIDPEPACIDPAIGAVDVHRSPTEGVHPVRLMMQMGVPQALMPLAAPADGLAAAVGENRDRQFPVPFRVGLQKVTATDLEPWHAERPILFGFRVVHLVGSEYLDGKHRGALAQEDQVGSQ